MPGTIYCVTSAYCMGRRTREDSADDPFPPIQRKSLEPDSTKAIIELRSSIFCTKWWSARRSKEVGV